MKICEGVPLLRQKNILAGIDIDYKGRIIALVLSPNIIDYIFCRTAEDFTAVNSRVKDMTRKGGYI